jgi:hypothetical protein
VVVHVHSHQRREKNAEALQEIILQQ